MSGSVCFFFILSFINFTTNQNTAPIVETKYGQLSGAWRNSVSGRSYASFEGIPYGATTARESRFQDPKEPASWSGVRAANAPGSPCLQYNALIPDPESRLIGSEDCLFLNVYTPDLTPSTPLPVIVFIHGGAYLFGSGDQYREVNMMDRDVVFVTLNYRLGPLGFLSTEDKSIAGNMGLKDQAFALKWVKNNIFGFGGDRDSVTLTGHSAGAASVHYHILSDLSKGTFHRAIMSSGSAFAPWSHQVNPLEKARKLAKHLGCSTETNKIIANCLRMKPAEDIVQAEEIFFDWNQNWFTVFAPSVEPSHVIGPFISEHPYVRAKNGKSQKVPLIISATNSEGLYPSAAYSDSDIQDLNSRWKQLASYVFVFEDTIPASRQHKVAEMIKSHFFKGKALSQATFPQLIEDPVEPASWSGVRQANATGSKCVQYSPLIADPASRVIGSEDCLFLNVYTSNVTPSTPLPVIVFIHGGAFWFGSGGMYETVNMMERDIVFITLNYRLGPLGFLSTGDSNIAGNMGLKDQAFALQWVQDNIHGFGGDPDSVTLIGHSAGSASVQYHMLSDLSKGTFHRAVMVSGSALAPWAVQVRPLEKARALAQRLGCSIETSEIIADCLRTKPAEDIAQAQDVFFAKDWEQNWIGFFVPCIESSDVEGPFITEHPYLLVKNGKSQKVPLIITATSSEGLFPSGAYNASDLDDLNSRWDELASYVLIFEDTIPASRQTKVAEIIKSHFFQGTALSQNTFLKLVQAYNERIYYVHIGLAAELHAATTGQPTYMYYYSFKGSNSTTFLLSGRTDFAGACHGDDIFHLVNPDIAFNSPGDTDITNLLLDFYYSFAKTGVPRSDGVSWQPLTPGSTDLNFLNIESPSEIKMGKRSNFGNRQFWDSLGFMENENIVHRS